MVLLTCAGEVPCTMRGPEPIRAVGHAWVRGLNAVVSVLIDPFCRSHIFAVMGGMMVMSGDIAIKGRASGSSWVIRAYPP